MRPVGASDRDREIIATKSAENEKKNREEGLERLVDAFSPSARCTDVDAGRAFPLPDIGATSAIFSPAVLTPKDVNILEMICAPQGCPPENDLPVFVFVARCGCVFCVLMNCAIRITRFTGLARSPTGCAIF